MDQQNLFNYVIVVMAIVAVLSIFKVLIGLSRIGHSDDTEKSVSVYQYFRSIVILALIVVTAVLGYFYYEYKVESYNERLNDELSIVIIKEKDWCFQQAAKFYQKDSFIDKLLYVPLFYRECIEYSKSNYEFCYSLEARISVLEQPSYLAKQCKSKRLSKSQCQTLLGIAQSHCGM